MRQWWLMVMTTAWLWHTVAVDAAPLPAHRLLDVWCAQPKPPAPQRGQRPRPPRPAVNNDESKGTTDAATVKAFWEQADSVLTGMKERPAKPPVVESADGRVVAIVDKAAVGLFYDEQGPTRYLAFHLRVGSTRTDQSFSWPRQEIAATLDGVVKSVEEIKSPLVNHGFQNGNDHVALRNCQPPTTLTLSANGVTGMWIVFGSIPVGGDLPKVTIRLPVEKSTLEIDVAEVQRAALQLQVDRIGPRGGLALVTMGGLLNTYNVYGVAEELDSLTEQKISRAVIQWTPTAPTPDRQLLNWLQQSAQNAGMGRGINEMLPTINGALKELHLVQLKGGGFSVGLYRGQAGAAKVHPTAADAVSAALRSGLLTLTREELREQILRGHPLARSAALCHGAPQLDQTDVSLLLRLSQDENVTIRAAALQALGDFTEVPEALRRLAEVARQDDEALAAVAIAAVVDSRFDAGYRTIKEWLAVPEVKLRTRVLNVLADHPRPEWGDALYSHAHGPDGRIRVEVLRALVPLDHPGLVSLLEEALKSPDKAMRDFAFPILALRTDERSETLASRYALSAIEQYPPDSAMMEFFTRTKDQRALPALLRHLETAPDRGGLINLLGQMGDQRTGDYLAQRYSKFKPHEQSAVLHALRSLRHEQFPELAAQALTSTDGALLSAATNGLQQEGDNTAVEALVRGLEKQTQSYGISMICNALSSIGTSAAREALLKQRASKEPARRNAGMQGLQNLQMRSPGYSYIHQARAHRVNRQEKEAMELYTLAIQIDPELADAYSGRGELQLKNEKWTDAAADLSKAAELDPYNGLACSGWAIALVMQGRYEDGVRTVEAARERLTNDVNYSYNAACVYGRLVEATLKQPESTERETRVKQYRQQALADLTAAIKLNFRDFAWMREDPDLKPLHDLPEFHEMIRTAEERKPE